MDGAAWVLIVSALIYSITLLIHRLVDVNCSIARLPVTWFYVSWIMPLVLLSLPLFKYFEAFSALSAAYVLGVLLSFSIGCLCAAFWSRSRREKLKSLKCDNKKDDSHASISINWTVALLIMGIIGTSLLLVNSVLGGGLSLTDRFNADNFAAIRQEHMMEAESRIGPLYGPATIMSAIGGLGVAFIFYLLGSKSKVLSQRKAIIRLAYMALVINATIGFIGFGSRMYAVFSVLIGFLAFAEGRWSIGEKLIVKKLTLKDFLTIFLSVVLVLVAVWVSATLFLQKRVQNQDANTLLYRTHRAALSTEMYDLTRTDTASQYFLFSLSYLTTPIPTLVYYIDLPAARQPGPFFGEYNFPALWRWGRRLTFTADPSAWDRARVEIFKPLADIQFGTNVWSTLIRDLMADFTKAGALVFIAGLGFLSQRTFDLQSIAPSARRAGLLVYIRILLAFSGLISILFMPQIHWALYLAMYMNLRGDKSRNRKNLKSGGAPQVSLGGGV